MYDLVITGGTLVTPGRTAIGDVAVIGEAIAEIAFDRSLVSEATEVIDATGKVVIPGGVDPHCHYSVPFGGAVSESQDYSIGLAFGGTTSIVDFHFHDTPDPVHDGLQRKKDEASGRMAVDYGLHVAMCGNRSFEQIEEIGDIIRGGCPTIKTLTTYDWMGDDGHRWGVISEVGAHGGMSVVHAEDDAIARWQTAKYLREGMTDGAYVSETRNALVEEMAVRRTMLLCERAGSPLYVLHMYAKDAVDAIEEGRASGLPFYGETLGLYLTHTQDDLWKEHGERVNNYPTLKTPADQDALWAALASGRLHTVGSDNCGMTLAQRDAQGTTVDSMQAGAPMAQMRLQLVYHRGVSEGRLTLEQFVDVVATNPAKLMGLYPQKGHLSVGADADIAILDPERRWTVHHEELEQESDYSPWDGWELKGKVVTTILRGQQIVRDERLVGSKTSGRFVARTLLRPVVEQASDLSFDTPVDAVQAGRPA
jgi:dihydropyrimidinase